VAEADEGKSLACARRPHAADRSYAFALSRWGSATLRTPDRAFSGKATQDELRRAHGRGRIDSARVRGAPGRGRPSTLLAGTDTGRLLPDRRARVAPWPEPGRLR